MNVVSQVSMSILLSPLLANILKDLKLCTTSTLESEQKSNRLYRTKKERCELGTRNLAENFYILNFYFE